MNTLDYFDQIKQTLQAKGAPDGWLNPPASPQAIKAAEEEMGYDLPDDWRQLYTQHNGESGHLGLFLGLPWLPLEEVLVQWRTWKGLEADYASEGTHFSIPSGAIRERYVNLGWIPLSHDWGGNHLGVDMAPGANGAEGQFINFGRDEELKFVLAQNTTDLFRFLAEEIASERCQLEDPSEAMSWCDGQNLMGEMRRMPLPLYQPQTSVQRPSGDLPSWKSTLAQPWPQVISDPEGFLANRIQYLVRKGLTDLEPLRWCQGLVGLYIARNEVRDLGPLSGLPDLQLIHATGNPIESVRSLQGLVSLRVLRLDDTRIEDLTPLASLPNLEELSLSGVPIRDLVSLAQSRRLRELSVDGEGVDLRPLEASPELETLSLSKADGAALSGLQELTQLQSLEVEPTAGVSLEALRGCSGLKHLRLRGASGLSMEWLEGLTSLETLSLSDCHLPDLNGLKAHPKLRLFSSRDSQVEDLSALATCSSLREVSGSYAQFAYLHSKVDSAVSFSSINGGMTDEERETWLRVCSRRRD